MKGISYSRFGGSEVLEYTKKYDLSFAHIVEIVIHASAQQQPLGQSQP
jgi:Mor family transcriptional regulator